MLDAVRGIVRAGSICPECLGRAFGRCGRGLSNPERGRALRLISSMLGEPEKDGECWVCGDLFAGVDSWAQRAAEVVTEREFETYLFGVRLSPRLVEMEAHFGERFATGEAEPLKHAFNREVGKCFERRFPGTTVSFDDPHASFLIDLARDKVTAHIASVFVYGRYRKLVRGIPQTRWPCRRCRGRGCEACGNTGKQYSESVEELIAPPFVEAAMAEGERFHGAGREDIDARMLGRGRPFVLELLSPRRRQLDLDELGASVNGAPEGKVEVSGLTLVRRSTVELVKETKARKRYRALVQFEGAVDSEAFTPALESLVGEIEQQTPRRVLHRRSDLLRKRKVFDATGKLLGPTQAEIELATEGGLYVKELVSGDGGRTAPNLAERVGVAASVSELDVIEVVSLAFPDASPEALDIADELP